MHDIKVLNLSESQISKLAGRDFVFDHLGIAVTTIQGFLEESPLGALLSKGGVSKILDPLQDVWVQFIEVSQSKIELIEPASPRSPVSNILRDKSYALHHVCFRVPNLNSALEFAELQGCVLIRSPLPAIALAHRKVAFVMGKDRLLWELLESDLSV